MPLLRRQRQRTPRINCTVNLTDAENDRFTLAAQRVGRTRHNLLRLITLDTIDTILGAENDDDARELIDGIDPTTSLPD